MFRFRYILIGVCLLAALVLTSCAGSASGNNTTTINVTLSDFKFDHSSWTVNAGKQVTVNLNNTASIDHTWTVMKTPINGSYTSADQSDIFYNSGPIAGGTKKSVTFTAPSTPGTYQVICTVQGHFESGMVGQLIVK
jgi:plastocyanin